MYSDLKNIADIFQRDDLQLHLPYGDVFVFLFCYVYMTKRGLFFPGGVLACSIVHCRF